MQNLRNRIRCTIGLDHCSTCFANSCNYKDLDAQCRRDKVPYPLFSCADMKSQWGIFLCHSSLSRQARRPEVPQLPLGTTGASAARGKGTLNDGLEGCAMAGGRSDRGARASASAGQRPPSCLLQVRPWSQALRQMQVGVAMEERPGASSSAEKRPRRHGPSRSRSLQP